MASHLITCIRTADVRSLHSLIFPSHHSPSSSPKPYLVNYPDSDGLNPIHHCVSVERPSSAVLDILYRAGADVSLSARKGQGSPLHCLARNARSSTPSCIKTFIQHLVIDLRAPLAARDDHLETCIHVAAEYGESAHVLDALLSCDASGIIRELRNSRG
jgi:ankyrin repeat protein